MKINAIAAAVITGLTACAIATPAVADTDFEFHGYVRSGTLWNTNDGNRRGYRMGLRANSEGYFRLGNEEDTKIELLPTLKWTGDDGVWAKFRVNLTEQTQDTGDWKETKYDGEDHFREAFIELGGFSFDPKAVIWAGKRYSQMEISSHQYSYDYLQNNGTGGGFENLSLGFATWDLGLYSYSADGALDKVTTRESEKKTGMPDETSVNTWLHGIGGSGLDVQFKYIKVGDVRSDNATIVSQQAQEGLLISLLYNTPGFFWFGNGYGKICAQYAKGADSGTKTGQNGWGWGQNRRQETYRVIFEGLWDVVQDFSISFFAMYQHDKALNEWGWGDINNLGTDRTADFYAIGVRPYHQISRHFAMQYEIGYEAEHHSGSDWQVNGTAQFWKATICPTLTLDAGYWGRPQLRAFATYGQWNKKTAQMLSVGETEFGNAKYVGNTGVLTNSSNSDNPTKHAFQVGIQAEAWF